MFAFSTAKAWWFARARPIRRRRLLPASWRKRQLVAHRVRDRTHGADPFSSLVSRWSASRADRPTRRSSHLPPTRPTAMTREGWRIWLAPASSSPCM
jgi:hypothetical protein